MENYGILFVDPEQRADEAEHDAEVPGAMAAPIEVSRPNPAALRKSYAPVS
jgi:hypothetical protein